MYNQRTLDVAVSCKGIGLHTGGEVSITIHPAPADHGIVFQKADESGHRQVRADFRNVGSTSFATTLIHEDFYVSTIEHLMSAFAGMGIDNALIEIDGDELPIMDGSSAPFATLIQYAGVRDQKKPRKYIQITSPIIVAEGDRMAALYPSNTFKVSYSIEFDHPMIRTQRFDADLITPDYFVTEIASARTFGFLSDLTMLKQNGFANGGGLDNAVVVGNYTVLNKGGLRYPDEFVRHKVLDALGDLYLAGYPILGQLVCKKSGHGLNHKLVERLHEEQDSWRFLELTPPEMSQEEEESFALA
jgi:UDP-3-O-[3-hydroxymyristoyl] N-acetylglucosamine deacetylase